MDEEMDGAYAARFGVIETMLAWLMSDMVMPPISCRAPCIPKSPANGSGTARWASPWTYTATSFPAYRKMPPLVLTMPCSALYRAGPRNKW